MCSVKLTQAMFRFLPCVLVACAAAHAQTTWYVDDDGAPTNGCTSWIDACPDLQTALGLAVGGDEIWVATGTYKPTPGTSRTATFQLITGVALYGGFAGTETSLGQRAGLFDQTILDGDLDGDDDPNPSSDCCIANGGPGCDDAGCEATVCADWPSCCDTRWHEMCGIRASTACCDVCGNKCENTYHVVTGSGTDATAVLDGFTITAGNANAPSQPENYGGGMSNGDDGSPTVTNCSFIGNSAFLGGGISNGWSSSPTVTNCTFRGNSAELLGGGMTNMHNATVADCAFIENSAQYGGGMYNSFGNPTVTNCTFIENLAYLGGGMENDYSCSPTLTNCKFTGNTAASGGGMYNFQASSPTITNCTFSGNTALWLRGGGMCNQTDCIPTVVNCTFSGNLAADRGGGLFNGISSNPTVTNCILWGNTAPTGAQIHNESSSPVVTYSDVQGGHSGTGNIDADPLFVDADGPDNVPGTEDDNLRVTHSSPCIDVGSNGAPRRPPSTSTAIRASWTVTLMRRSRSIWGPMNPSPRSLWMPRLPAPSTTGRPGAVHFSTYRMPSPRRRREPRSS
jgi:hypothetical protein